MNTKPLKDKTILIVDDYPINIELLRLILEEADAMVLSAQNGLECIDIVKNSHVDMILMDRNMPEMNGIEATRAVRALPRGADIVIIGISGDEEEEDAAACLDAGMNSVTGKLSLSRDKLAEIGEQFFGHADNCAMPPGRPPEQPVADVPQGDAVQVMDYKKALHEFENDNDLLGKLMVDFNSIIQKQMEVLRSAFEENAYERIRVESHGMKGGAANLCALQLAEAARAVENACKQMVDRKTMKMLLDTLLYEIRSFDAYIAAGKFD